MWYRRIIKANNKVPQTRLQEKLVNLFRQIHLQEKGFAMLTAIILLLIGMLIITPTLKYMSTGIQSTTVHNKNMHEYYSAEAGFEDAYWELTTNDLEVSVGTTYAIPAFILNDKTVDVAITNLGNSTHKVTSLATSPDGSTTTIESHLGRFNFFDNAITSNGDIEIGPGSLVDGNVWYDGNLDNKGTITGQQTNAPIPLWPSAEDLADEYFDDIDSDDDGSPDFVYGSSSLDLKNYASFGPLYRDGDLEIKNTGSATTSQLDGTIYITGDLDFKQPGGPKAYTIDLNGHTIFVEGNITFPPHRVSIDGSGCIIAIGDIKFQPGVESDEDDFVFIFSIEGEVQFKPQDDFNGSIAGNVNVDLQPNVDLTHEGDPHSVGLNFPIDDYETWSTLTWDISQS